MKGFFIDKGTEVGVYRGGFDKNWIVKDRHSFFRHTTRKDLFIDLADCSVVDDGHGQIWIDHGTPSQTKWSKIVVTISSNKISKSSQTGVACTGSRA